jgi:hypothetical protein
MEASSAGDLYWLLDFASSELENSRVRLTEMLNVDWTVISRVFDGSYPSLPAFIKRVRRLRDDITTVGRIPFIDTIVSEKLFSMFDYARAGDARGGFMVKAISPAGRGKTECGREYVRRHPGAACYMKVDPSTTYSGFKEKLARAMGIGEDRRDKRPLTERIEDRANRDLLLIVDEASLLLPSGSKVAVRELELLRHLHDSKRMPIALLVTRIWDDQSQSPRLANWLEQFNRRLQDGIAIPAEIFRDREVKPIVTAFRRDPPNNLVQLAHDIANNKGGDTPGRLEILFRLLVNASIVARAKGEPLSHAHLLAARDNRANRNRWPGRDE